MSLSFFNRALLGAGFLAASVSQPAAARFSDPSAAPVTSVQITGSFTGILVDQYTGRPLQQVSIALVRQTDEQLTAGAMTAENGEFRLDRATFGHYVLHVEAPGYQPLREEITLAAGRELLDLGTFGLVPLLAASAKTQALPTNALALDAAR